MSSRTAVKATRVVRDTPGRVGTEDGYVYRWDEPGQAIDVLPQHQADLLASPGFSAVEVELLDPPVVVPILQLVDGDETPTLLPPAPAADVTLDVATLKISRPVLRRPKPEPATLVAPSPVVDEPLDVDALTIDPPVLPSPVTAEETLVPAAAQMDDVLDVEALTVDPPLLPTPETAAETRVVPETEPETPIDVKVTPHWSTADLALLALHGGQQ